MSLSPRKPRQRLDLILVERGLAPSRARAQAMVMAGLVEVDGQRAEKPGSPIRPDSALRVIDRANEFVSRGGHKLQGALEAFRSAGLDVTDKLAADFGASTGGFVDCLLRYGAKRVHAIDVGHGLLHERLRGDERVIVHERTNARHLTWETLGERVDVVVIDASFISLLKLLEAASHVLVPAGELVALIKPQFEAGKREVSKGKGVIRDEETRMRVIHEVIEQVQQGGFEVVAQAPCVLPGPKGNVEHFLYGIKRRA